MTAGSRDANDAIAIVGIGCRFPGGFDGPEGFWRQLCAGADGISDIPADRMDVEALYAPATPTPGKIASRRGGYLSTIDELDAGFFGISPREAERLDPQHRLLLETTWEAFEDAGLDAQRWAGEPVGVFVGQWQSDFEGRTLHDLEGADLHATNGAGRYASSGRISYTFGFTGPSLTIDTACSSSLYAALLACRSIRDGESSIAIAAGINIILQPNVNIAYAQTRVMSPDGWCKFGDARADGYVRSEGCGVLLLRKLDDAIAAGDRIYAVVRGGAMNNDGRGSGAFGRPSKDGHRALLDRAYRDAGVSPARVGYVEAHGTGTRVGDPIEIDALSTFFSGARSSGSRTLLGSVKTNFGHTEAAAGVAGVIKCALALRNGVIPGDLHYETPNPAIPWDSLPFEIPRVTTPWPERDGPRVAGISSYGISGSNAHLVLEEWPSTAASSASTAEARSFALPLSARSPESLAALAGLYAERLAANDAPALGDLCRSAAMLRSALPHRAVFVAEDASAMGDRLSRFAAGEREAASAVGEAHANGAHRVAFVFPGQGAQWIGMGRELMRREPAFRDAIVACDEALREHCDWSLLEQLDLDEGSPRSRTSEIGVIQPMLLAIEIALAKLWREWGVEPTAVVGHSMGEVGAAHIAGVLTLDDAMRVICARSSLMQRTSGQGAMGLVDLPRAEVESRLAPWAGRLSIAVESSVRSAVVSGEPTAVTELLARLEADGVFCRQIKVDVASHSAQMDPLAPELVAHVQSIQIREATYPIYSTVTGELIDGASLVPAYWGRNLRETVRFTSAIQSAVANGIDCLIELGPHPMLVHSMQQICEHSEPPVHSAGSLRRNEPEQAALLASIGALWANGHQVDWSRVMHGSWRRVPLPRYPWNRQRYWHASAELARSGESSFRERQPDDESLTWLYSMRWEPIALPEASDNGVWIVAARSKADATALATALRSNVANVANVDVVQFDSLDQQIQRMAARSNARTSIIALASAGDDPYLAVSIAQSIVRQNFATAPRLAFVTVGAQAVDRSQCADAYGAALWGAARVVSEEHPELDVRLIDLGTAMSPRDAELVARALSIVGEDEIAIRDGRVFAHRLAALDRANRAGSLPRLRSDASYLVTGGLGDVGMHLASALVDAGARRLVLLGRTALPPRTEWRALPLDSANARRAAAIRALEAKGVAVHVLTADVGNESELAATLAEYAAEGWPPIRGVIHAVGLLENALVRDMSAASFERVVAPKLRGALHLDRLLPDAELFVLVSSTGGFLAQAGQANYAAANAGLDAIAHDRRARGRHALSIAWGVWENTGIVRAESAARGVDEMRRQGVQPFTPARGASLFRWLLRRDDPMVAVLPIDWSAFYRSRADRSPSLYGPLIESAGKASGGSPAPSVNLAARIRAASPSERREMIESALREIAGNILRMPAAGIDARRPFGSMGLDSLMALEFRNRLGARLERSLPATLLWNYPTINALASHLVCDVIGQPAPSSSEPAADEDSVMPQLDDLVAMSDEDVARALRGGRGSPTIS